MNYQTLLYETRGGIAYVTLNRPEKLNALNHVALGEIEACFGAIQKDNHVLAVILTGSGERAFAAGADVAELAELADPTTGGANLGSEAAQRGQRVLRLIENLGKPVIAAVRGYAVGGGCELAMACTLRIASETARFGQPEVKLGLIPGYGGSQRLARLVGKGRAFEIILTGEMITAAEAYRIGLVNRVVPDQDLITAAETLARKIMANAPLAVRRSLEAVHHGMECTQVEGENLESALFGQCCGTEDMKEGTRAFLEKRPPKFAGK
ncbi:MAG TPA: enoyl-CoA hydratase-related protein [Terriglobia bacterium]|nr:enoyl-CoA hydratase-related protein [Terriglobia bacterium]